MRVRRALVAIVACAAACHFAACGGSVRGSTGTPDPERTDAGAAAGGRRAISDGASGSGGRSSPGGASSGSAQSVAGHAGADAGASTGDAGRDADGGAGTLPPSLLAGSYDVELPVADVPGCSLGHLSGHVNLVLREADGGLESFLFYDYEWSHANASLTTSVSDVVVAPDDGGGFVTRRPTLHLSVGPNGFSGSGDADVPLQCDDGTPRAAHVPVFVTSDLTAPRLRIVPQSAGPWVFPFTLMTFEFSEPVDAIGGFAAPLGFSEVTDAERIVSLVDATTGDRMPFSFRWWPWGPIAAAGFSDWDGVSGRSFRAKILSAAHDFAGNQLVADDGVFPVHAAEMVTGPVDLDLTPVDSVYGSAVYHATGEAGSPCESGACLSLEGPVLSCSEWRRAGPPSLLAVRVKRPDAISFLLHYRVWSSGAEAPPLVLVDALSCRMEIASNVKPLGMPDGVYTYASDPDTLGAGCADFSDTGFVVALGCRDTGLPQTARVVIEGIDFQSGLPPDAGP